MNKSVSLAGSLIAAVFVLLNNWNCSSGISYRADYPLTAEKFFSRDGNFSGKIPQGWMLATGRGNDSLAPALVALIVKNDYDATISFRELVLDKLTTLQVENKGLPVLAKISKSLAGRPNDNSEPQLYDLGGKQFCSYELPAERVVLFRARSHYYECVIRGAKVNDNVEPLVTIQQSILSSLSF